MRKVELFRMQSSEEGTFGRLITDKGKSFMTAELPWKKNQSNISCIPEGVYLCKIRQSTKHGYYFDGQEGRVYELEGVPKRNNIEIHVGNFAGDMSKGFKTNVEGCILLGMKFGKLTPFKSKPEFKQNALWYSRDAFKLFMEVMNYEDFELHIMKSN